MIFLKVLVFTSMFAGLRGMSILPVESMSIGGTLWFEDLTLPDPFYILPILTSCTLFLQLKFAADGMNLDLLSPTMRRVMLASPVAIILFSKSFPAVRLS